MCDWEVCWYDGQQLRLTMVYMCDVYVVVSKAMEQGVFGHAIISIERVEQ